MNRFEDLWKNAVKQLGNQALEEHLDKLNFPGQLAVLANRGFGLDTVPLRVCPKTLSTSSSDEAPDNQH